MTVITMKVRRETHDKSPNSTTTTLVNIKKSSRVRNRPVKLQDYVCTTISTPSAKYPLSAYDNYAGCSTAFQTKALILLEDFEPKFFS